MLRTALLALLVFFGVPAAVGWAWGKWQMHAYNECSKSRECRERRAESAKYFVDDEEIPDAANMNYYRGE